MAEDKKKKGDAIKTVLLFLAAAALLVLLVLFPVFRAVLGWALLGLLVLLVLILVLPGALVIDYCLSVLTVCLWPLVFTLSSFSPLQAEVVVRVGRLTLYRLPITADLFQKKEEEKPQAEKEDPEKPKSKKSSAPATLEEWADMLERILTAASAALRFFIRRLRIRGVELVYPVSGSDVADTALRWGVLQALLGSLHALFENSLNIRYKRLVLIPDFAGQYNDSHVIFSCKIISSLFIILVTALLGLKEFFAPLLRRRKKAAKRSPAGAAPPKKPAAGV